MKQTATLSIPRFLKIRAMRLSSLSFRGVRTSPSKLIRSGTVCRLYRGTRGGAGSQVRSNTSGRSPRAPSRTSRKPSVVTKPVLAPLRSRMAFVAMVEPWRKVVMSFGSRPVFFRTSITPSMNVGGVEGILWLVTWPVSSLRHTKSVNVPPMSIPTL